MFTVIKIRSIPIKGRHSHNDKLSYTSRRTTFGSPPAFKATMRRLEMGGVIPTAADRPRW